MSEQTEVFEKMTAILLEVEKGSDPANAAETLSTLGEELKQLKISLAELDHSDDGNGEALKEQSEQFAKATAAFQMAQQKLFMSGKLTPEINQALKAHLNSAPMTGEGSPQ